MGAVNQFNKFIPDLASTCFPFRSILKKDAVWNWTPEHEKAFMKVHSEVKRVVELTHFKKNKPLRIICDASKQGVGAVLQQCEENQWKPISYASRFLTELETKYSMNELELLAVVWSVEHFENYVYGVRFGVVSDHKALQSVLKSNKGNKTYSSRLPRWADRLLPFDFSIVHKPGRTLGMADYLSRHPSPYEGNVVKAEELFNNWFTINVIDGITPTLNKAKRAESAKPIKSQNRNNESNTQVSTIHASVHTLTQSNQVDKLQDIEKMADLANSKISKVYVQANYDSDKTIQKVIRLVKDRNVAVISRLSPSMEGKV